MSETTKKKILAAVAIGFATVSLVMISKGFALVEAGTVGVVTHFGAVQPVILEEGLHVITPFRTRIVPVNIRVQKVEADASAFSKDLQIVTSRVALNFRADKAKADKIYQKLSLDYYETIIEPRIQESVKSTTAKYTAEQLITKRAEVRNAIYRSVKERLKGNNILVTDFSIVDFSFSREFNRAIESKQVAQQAALRARNDLNRIKTEAEQVIARAKGDAEAKLEIAKAEAEAQKLLRSTLDQKIIRLRAIEKWNGKLPLSLGKEAHGPFFDVVGAAKIRKSQR